MTVHSKNFSIDRPGHLGGGHWILEGVSDMTVVFGRNASGKSQLLRALLNQDREHYHYASPERGGEISYNPALMQEEFDSNTRANKRQKNIAPTYRDEVIARITTILAKRGDIRAEYIKHDPTEIQEILRILLPDFTFKIIGGQNPPYELERIDTGEIVKSVDVLSSGESQIFTLGLDLLTICALWELEDKKLRLLLIDEPDLHLHPDLQQHLAHFLIRIIERYKTQILVATHSTTLLSALGHYGDRKTSVIYLDTSKENQKAVSFNKVLRKISSILGGHALMGPLFSFPLLLVEGDDDYKIWSQAVRHLKLKLAVLPCDGDEIMQYAKSLEKIFASLLEETRDTPAPAYVLRDRDEREELTHDQSDKHVKLLQLACREAENLYLTDEVLGEIGINWDAAKEKIIASAGNFGQKQSRIKQVATSNKKTTDLKGLMEELTQILDPEKKVDWRIRVGSSIGKEKPTGQLAEFLGEGVVSVFWPES